jgi:hypothetical protein
MRVHCKPFPLRNRGRFSPVNHLGRGGPSGFTPLGGSPAGDPKQTNYLATAAVFDFMKMMTLSSALTSSFFLATTET